MFSWLPSKRYFWRELAPRAVLLTVLFKYLLPLLPFGLVEFRGGIVAAALFGLAFTAMFMVFGSYVMGAEAVGKWMDHHKTKWWFIPANMLFVVGLPALALMLAQVAAPAVISLHGISALLVGSLLLNIACAITHDYGAGQQQ